MFISGRQHRRLYLIHFWCGGTGGNISVRYEICAASISSLARLLPRLHMRVPEAEPSRWCGCLSTTYCQVERRLDRHSIQTQLAILFSSEVRIISLPAGIPSNDSLTLLPTNYSLEERERKSWRNRKMMPKWTLVLGHLSSSGHSFLMFAGRQEHEREGVHLTTKKQE